MRKAIVVLLCLLVLAPGAVFAQDEQSSASTTSQSKPAPKEQIADVEKALAIKQANEANPRFIRALTNVQVELTISDQISSSTPQKKTVSMIVAASSWGKIRAAAQAYSKNREFPVSLSVDARPFVTVDNTIQLELTMFYSPLTTQSAESDQVRPTELNQSLTVALQNGKPLTISQAADPITDRKITVEVKATILK